MTTCRKESCPKPVKARGMCSTHYARWRKSNPDEIQRRPHYGKGRRVRDSGYVDVWAPDHPLARTDGYVFEHRMVAWDAGLFTDPSLQVHHLDHNKQNNSLSNLAVVDAASHISEHHPATAGPPVENAEKTHCKRGHVLSGDNIYPNQLPRRVCRQCQSIRDERRST